MPIANGALGALGGAVLSDLYRAIHNKITGRGFHVPHHRTTAKRNIYETFYKVDINLNLKNKIADINIMVNAQVYKERGTAKPHQRKPLRYIERPIGKKDKM